MHNHRAQLSKRRSESWRYCVLKGRSIGHSDRYHGVLMMVDVCACGAVRRSERSGQRTAYGAWEPAQ